MEDTGTNSRGEAPQPVQKPGTGPGDTRPRKARFVLRVGVTGHRDLEGRGFRVDAVRKRIRNVLGVLVRMAGEACREGRSNQGPAWCFSGEKPVVRIISPLAMGTDQILAEEARAMQGNDHGVRIELQCTFPAPLEEYLASSTYRFDAERIRSDPSLSDREREAVENVRCLIEDESFCTSILELGGSGLESEPAAYETIGRLILEQSDILLAVWDGRPARGRGGTGDIVKVARGLHMPTMIIHTEDTEPSGDDGSPEETLAAAARDILRFDPDTRAPSTTLALIGLHVKDALARWYRNARDFLTLRPSREYRDTGHDECRYSLQNIYLSESPPGSPWLPLSRFWPALLRFTGDFPLPGTLGDWIHLPGRLQRTFSGRKNTAQEDAGSPPEEGGGSGINSWIAEPYREHLDRADTLAKYHAGMNRLSFVLVACLGVLAVLCALVALIALDDPGEHGLVGLFVTLELVLILVMLTIYILSKARFFHRKSVDYRLLAEHFRQMEFLAPLAIVTASSRPMVQYPAGNLTNDWTNRYFRSIVRDIGLPRRGRNSPDALCIDEGYLRDFLQNLRKNWIQDQIEYHRNTTRRNQRLFHLLERSAIGLFVLTILVCLGHWFFSGGSVYTVLGLFAALFPAAAAACHAISVQAELHRISQRSRAMISALTGLDAELKGLVQRLDDESSRDSKPKWMDVVAVVKNASRCMIEETVEWRVVLLAHPPHPPG